MNNIHKTILFICLLLPITTYSQKLDEQDFTTKIINQFSRQWINQPQEKLYLHTDKPYYNAGEDIWFKGYLVNATTHIPNSLSKFIYVELIDKSDSAFYRIKVRNDSSCFAGCIKLKPELPSGYYNLRAYTYWMQNATSDFFFNKSVYIGNSIDDRTQSKISYGTTVNGKTPVVVSLTNANDQPIIGQKVRINQVWKNAPKKKINSVTDSEGKLAFEISIDSTNTSNKKNIEVSIDEPNYKYNAKFYLPNLNNDFDVQFLPESGVFLNNYLQTMAFKAIGTDGLSVEVSGKVYNKIGEEITEFSSINNGMGKFIISAQPNESYYTIVKSAKGNEKRFNLPASQNEGVSIHFAYNKDKILYEIQNRTSIPNNSLFMLIHVRGKVIVMQSIKTLVGQITESLLPEGIVSFAIVDSAKNTLCERLCFVKATTTPIFKLQSNKDIYRERDSVILNININSYVAKPIVGNFSISVTDSKTVKTDSLADNILSNLLLTSDLKGHVENPAGYFLENNTISREKMDVLMLTQAWRRFNTAEVVKGKHKTPTFYLEIGQALSGKVMNLLNKPSKNCGIIMLSPYKGTVKLCQTDSLGRYLIDGIEFPDSTSFILKAKKRKSLTDVEIIPDNDEFPKPFNILPSPRVENIAPKEYLRLSKEKYYYEGGMRVVNLGEVTITGQKKKSESESNYYSGMGDSQLTAETLERSPNMSIMSILSTIAGVMVMGDQISIRGSQGQPMIMIDNIETEGTEEISYLTTNDVEEITVFKGASAAIFGLRGGNGVIAITLKKGYIQKAGVSPSLAIVKPLGYQKPVEFYVPKYQIDSVRLDTKPDLRTTIYWNPRLVTDSTGNVQVKFYTADKANNYSIIIEGVSADGEICRYVGYLRRQGM
jgi:TonB-dependent SusC/RagA subfamily outer membrane receptor